jgi:hypothetical protein
MVFFQMLPSMLDFGVYSCSLGDTQILGDRRDAMMFTSSDNYERDYFIYLLAVLEFEFRTLHLLGKHSTTAVPPILCVLDYFLDKILPFLPGICL